VSRSGVKREKVGSPNSDPWSRNALAERKYQPKVDVRRPRWRPRSVSPKGRSGVPNLKRTVVSDKVRSMVQTCSTKGLWEGRKSPSKNGGQIAPKESADEKLLWPKMMGQKNDSEGHTNRTSYLMGSGENDLHGLPRP
jgi:hypothetical protein